MRRPTAARRRAAAILAIALTTALLAAACGSATSPEEEGGGRTAIELTLFGGPAEIAGYTRMVEDFEAANPDVDVVLTPVASQDDLLANLTTSFAGGRPPDVFLVNYLKYGQFAAQGVLVDVQDLVDAGSSIDLDDLADPPLDAFRFDGERLTCMPQNISSLVVYTNLDAFDAAGVAHPTAGWTWTDLLDAATAMTDPDEGRYGVGVEPSLQRLAPFVWSAGGELVDDPSQPTTLRLGDPAVARGLDFLLDLQLVHGVAPPDAEEQSQGAEERFVAGRLGMYLDSRRVVPTLREGITDFTWDVAPLPVAPGGQPATILHGDAYCLTRDGDPETAWRLVEHAMSVEGQEVLAESGRTVPSRLDVARSPAFLEPDDPPASAEVFLDVIPTIRSLPHTATWSQAQGEVDDVFADTFYGRIGRADGIAAMIAAAEAVFGG
ncbi:sugar ABC transporter substrate-binding protein [Euzebya sp.]|uniref:ABC transporter substrate-binding protein n=1 Tax=Euzebya sp. TaxID=1971409 RepID=UPI00351242D9